MTKKQQEQEYHVGQVVRYLPHDGDIGIVLQRKKRGWYYVYWTTFGTIVLSPLNSINSSPL